MASTILQRLRRFNGTDYDTIHLETETGAISDYPYPSNPNLLDNWYFVGGGSQQGNGRFPINQRDWYVVPQGVRYRLVSDYSVIGDTTQYYTVAFIDDTSNPHFYINGVEYYVDHNEVLPAFVPGYTGYGYGIDRWTASSADSSADFSVLLNDDSVGLLVADTMEGRGTGISQVTENSFAGKTITLSVIIKSISGVVTLAARTADWGDYGTISITNPGLYSYTVTIPSSANSNFRVAIYSNSVQTMRVDIVAVKLELGSLQTLAHQDANGNWVLNEIPNYQEQLLRCQTSKADSADTYANKTNVVDSYHVRPNLLDNWYFVGGGSQQGGGQFPINQRGGYIVPAGTQAYADGTGADMGILTSAITVTEIIPSNNVPRFYLNGILCYSEPNTYVPGYTGNGYGIDRWKTNPGIQTTVLINSDGVTLISDSNNSSELIQVLEPGSIVVGNIYTLSILVKALKGYCAATIWNGNTINLKVGMNTLTFEATSDTYKGILPIRALGGSIKISAVKLELGDTQTLAHQDSNGNWVLNEIPNYQEQLRMCQRYFEALTIPTGEKLYQYNDKRFYSKIQYSQKRAIPEITITNDIYPCSNDDSGIYGNFVDVEPSFHNKTKTSVEIWTDGTVINTPSKGIGYIGNGPLILFVDANL